MTETPGISWGYWKARNMPALARSSAGQSVTSSPRNVIVPAVTSYSGEPISVDASVLLPEPLGPMMAWTSPAPTIRSSPRTMGSSEDGAPTVVSGVGATHRSSTRNSSRAMNSVYAPGRIIIPTAVVEMVRR